MKKNTLNRINKKYIKQKMGKTPNGSLIQQVGESACVAVCMGVFM